MTGFYMIGTMVAHGLVNQKVLKILKIIKYSVVKPYTGCYFLYSSKSIVTKDAKHFR